MATQQLSSTPQAPTPDEIKAIEEALAQPPVIPSGAKNSDTVLATGPAVNPGVKKVPKITLKGLLSQGVDEKTANEILKYETGGSRFICNQRNIRLPLYAISELVKSASKLGYQDGILNLFNKTVNFLCKQVYNSPCSEGVRNGMECMITDDHTVTYIERCAKIGLCPYDEKCLAVRFDEFDDLMPVIRTHGYETLIRRNRLFKAIRYARSTHYVQVVVPGIENRLDAEIQGDVLKIDKRAIEVPDCVSCMIENSDGTVVEGHAYASDLEGACHVNEFWARYPERMYEQIAFRRAAAFYFADLEGIGCEQSSGSDNRVSQSLSEFQRFRSDQASEKIAKLYELDKLHAFRDAIKADPQPYGPFATELLNQIDTRDCYLRSHPESAESKAVKPAAPASATATAESAGKAEAQNSAKQGEAASDEKKVKTLKQFKEYLLKKHPYLPDPAIADLSKL